MLPARLPAAEIDLEKSGFYDALLQSCMKLPLGVVLADRSGAVIWRNEAAMRVLERGDGFVLCGGRIRSLPGIYDSCPVQEAIAHIALPDEGRRHGPREKVLLIERAADGAPYGVRVFLLNPDGLNPDGHARPAPIVVLHISGPCMADFVSQDNMKTVFGLTKTETRVALCIAQGHGVKACEERLNISQQTIRTHLRNIRHKTNTRSQSELASFILSNLSALYG